jgi:hypothetical protein
VFRGGIENIDKVSARTITPVGQGFKHFINPGLKLLFHPDSAIVYIGEDLLTETMIQNDQEE